MTIIYQQRDLLILFIKRQLEPIILQNIPQFIKLYHFACDEGNWIAMNHARNQIMLDMIETTYVIGFIFAYCIDRMHMVIAHHKAMEHAIKVSKMDDGVVNGMNQLYDLVMDVMRTIINDNGYEL